MTLYRIKPLEWFFCGLPGHMASSCIGDLWVSRCRTEGGYIATWQCDDDNGNHVYIEIGRAAVLGECEAIAERWYQERMKAGLEEATDDDIGKEVRYRRNVRKLAEQSVVPEHLKMDDDF